ncbi:MAG: asparagine synthetase B family protein, partial [Candidatus Hodarchaeota archaeon]
MCGICGVYQYRSGERVSEQLLRDMLGVIRHRGPDDEGVYIDKDLALGVHRLSIIDLAGGKQPIWNEDKSVVVVSNGEIYNYRELTEQLQQRGHVFTTAVDTEVIVHLYEESGEDCVHELRGMFAFAVWDVCNRRLFLARDRLGIKPLYYTQIDQGLVFGSEIKAILQHPKVQARMRLESLSNYLSLRYVPAPQTMFADIFAVPPGHTLTCDQESITLRSYWNLAFASNENNQGSDQ